MLTLLDEESFPNLEPETIYITDDEDQNSSEAAPSVNDVTPASASAARHKQEFSHVSITALSNCVDVPNCGKFVQDCSESESTSCQESSSQSTDFARLLTQTPPSLDRLDVTRHVIEVERRRHPISQYWTESIKEQESSELELLKLIVSDTEDVQRTSGDSYLLPDLKASSGIVSQLSHDEFRNIHAQDVTIYHVLETEFSDFSSEPKKDALGYMCMPSQLLANTVGQVFIDLTILCPVAVSGVDKSLSAKRLTRLQVIGMSIGTSLDGPLQIWIESVASRGLQLWYQLRSSSEEYVEYWSDFHWLANFTRFAIGYLETLIHSESSLENHTFQGSLSHFKYGFYAFLSSLSSVEAQEVQTQYGKSDYRQAFGVHAQFIWHVANGMSVQESPIFSEVFCASIQPHKWSLNDKTVVTPYVYECFSHIFNDYMRIVRPRSEVQEMSHIDIYHRHTEVSVSCYEDVRPGEFVRFKPNENPQDSWAKPMRVSNINKSRSRESICVVQNARKLVDTILVSQEMSDDPQDPHSTRPLTAQSKVTLLEEPYKDYMYITEVLHRPTIQKPERQVYRGLWCYLPGTWHTHLDTSFYKYKDQELFLSDHCNCPENYADHVLAEFQDIECKVVVNLFSGERLGHQFFCRFMYLHDEGNFETLTTNHLDSGATQLPCGCMTTKMREINKQKDHYRLFRADYSVGDPVLVDIARFPSFEPQTGMLEPFIIDCMNDSDHTITFLQLIRRAQTDASCLPNELLVGERRLTVNARKARTSVQRKFGLWYCYTGKILPDQVQLNGSGEQFFIRSAHVSNLVTTPEAGDDAEDIPENLKYIHFMTIEASFTKLRGLDLFSGAGNLGEGIRDAGVVQYASIVDVFAEALHSYKANHVFQKGDDDNYESDFYLGSVNRFLEADITHGRKHIPEIDFIVAGSPCQGFSQANVNKDTEASLRNCSLIASFASYLDFYRPKYAVLENVPGLGDNVRLPNGRIINVHRQLLAMAVGLGYQVRTYVNHAWMHGSAQQRTRIFVVFAAAGLVLPAPPVQSHEHPANHNKSEKLRGPHGNVYHNPMTNDDAPKAFRTRFLRDIWDDLPNLGAGHRLCITHPEHHLAARVSYAERQICRLYGGFAPSVATKVSHRHRRSRPGYANSHAKTASEMHKIGLVPLALAEANPVIFRPGSRAYGRTDPGRLLGTVLTRPCPRAKLGAPCIHYEQPRRYTILEAKRAQGFLDHDILLGSPANKMKQIGNSVSRHASYAIGLTIRQAMLQNLENEKRAGTLHTGAAHNPPRTGPDSNAQAAIPSKEFATVPTPMGKSGRKRQILDDSEDESAITHTRRPGSTRKRIGIWSDGEEE